MLNASELARDADIDTTTAQDWLSILQASHIIHLLHPYASSLTARLVKTPKLYFLDTGLCSFLTHWPTPETLEAGAMAGHIFECMRKGRTSLIHVMEDTICGQQRLMNRSGAVS